MTTPTRLAIVATHPIQHFVPLYRALAAERDLTIQVFYGSRVGLKSYFDVEMNTSISWSMDLLGDYPHSFLAGAEDVQTIGFSTPDSSDLAEALDRFAPDAVLVYGYAQRNALRALWWCVRRRVPVLMIGDSELRSPRPAGRERIRTMLLPLIYSRVAAFLTVGDENERYLAHYGVARRKMFRSPFTIDESAFAAARAQREQLRREVRATYGVADRATLFLQVGKLSERKRPLDAISALARIDQAAPVHLLMAGNGTLLESAQGHAKADPRVTLAGFVNVDRLPALYAAADALVHTASADPHPLVCSEAAIMGLPMVLSDRVGAVGPTDVARPGINAITYPCGDIAALADSLTRLSEDGELRATMGAASRAVFGEVDLASSVRGLKTALASVARA